MPERSRRIDIPTLAREIQDRVLSTIAAPIAGKIFPAIEEIMAPAKAKQALTTPFFRDCRDDLISALISKIYLTLNSVAPQLCGPSAMDGVSQAVGDGVRELAGSQDTPTLLAELSNKIAIRLTRALRDPILAATSTAIEEGLQEFREQTTKTEEMLAGILSRRVYAALRQQTPLLFNGVSAAVTNAIREALIASRQ